MAYDFKGKTALVTGGSRGIGKEVVRQLTKYGADVIALGKSKENLDALKKEIPSVQTICVDIADWKTTQKTVEGLENVDLLVNNAGIGESTLIPNITEEQFDRIFSVNVKAVINISQLIVKKLKDTGKSGSIVNVSSVASMKSHPPVLVYSASKAALDRLTKVMAVELGPNGIRVNAVNPTAVDTDMAKDIINNPERLGYLKKITPMGDYCTVEDIADAILFLLSDKARMISGVILPVDGAISAT